jgi:hypothetical protein
MRPLYTRARTRRRPLARVAEAGLEHSQTWEAAAGHRAQTALTCRVAGPFTLMEAHKIERFQYQSRLLIMRNGTEQKLIDAGAAVKPCDFESMSTDKLWTLHEKITATLAKK